MIEQQLTEQQILVNLGHGDWHSGFANVTVQLWSAQQPPFQFVGSLPPAPNLATSYRHWQQLYDALYGIYGIPYRGGESSHFEFDDTALTNVSKQSFEELGVTLKETFNQWLGSASFSPVERQMRTHLTQDVAIRVMLTASEKTVLRFPWRLWQLFEDYLNAELSLSLPNYSRSLKTNRSLGCLRSSNNNPVHPSAAAFDLPVSPASGYVRILAVLGSDEGINVETDRQLLDNLPLTDITLLVQPTLEDLQRCLWSSCWDVLFFAGHSNSQGRGHLQVNSTESLTIDQLKFALRRAVSNGLQLAIFNSCEGLELAWELAGLQVPQAIVMREPVPDVVAQQFLKAFLLALSNGQSLYLSVREAREKLYGLTVLGGCVTWLPIIVQNPAETPPTWQSLSTQQLPVPIGSQFGSPAVLPLETLVAQKIEQNPRTLIKPGENGRELAQRRKPFFIWQSLAITAVLLALRWSGLLQGAELWSYDWLMRLRPIEQPDSRLVVITVTENDIQSQTSPERRGSLSDQTLQRTLSTLASYEPRVVGLDLYRDFPSTLSDLTTELARAQVVGICKSRDPTFDEAGIGAAPELSESQIGFSDFLEESDGILRRQLLSLTPDPVSPCTASYGFATLVAIYYLRAENLQPTFTAQGNFQLGETILPRLRARTGGLQRLDHRGNQILLNYRALPNLDKIAAQVPLQKLLDGEVNPNSLRDRIVLIGVTAPSGDYWSTVYGARPKDKTPGVFIQAQMVSQLISAVLDNRPLIWVWPQWVEVCCIGLGALLGSWLGWRWKSAQLFWFCLIIFSSLTVLSWVTLLAGGWLPLIPVSLALSSGILSTKTFSTSRALTNTTMETIPFSPPTPPPNAPP